ncbi:hypothetical protein TTHERM_01400700 (macronuclear) [Tetrahymena thermophila SB210]|uniref:Uncharacterized protein n=1 Tax=Tetrahymena thermophila (strain SB210) TaxID=312017 RepID=Q229H9_TETTS|nr:hypothetical protein TTHERM_01400700 [Tetrahymena thermophila SB210]EAR81946.1 hypothetical protein TTHERM_01400700 [Tetrahymena thermophila SB210]|eukprot:XP_001029609.1 hypothetical protein TTHERM_01400700 [Tetrahymena thermophila SB210]
MEIEGFEYIQAADLITDQQNIGMILKPLEYSLIIQQELTNQSKKDIYNQNVYEQDSEDSKEETKKLQISRQKKIQKKKIKKVKQHPTCLQICIFKDIYSAELFKLDSGIFITLDGVLRFSYSLSPVSFGFCPYKYLKFEEMSDLSVIDIHQSLDRLIPRMSIEDCVNLMMQKNLAHKNKQDLQEQLMNINTFTDNLYNNNTIPYDLKMLKEQEYQGFIKYCYQYIKEMQKQQENIPFSYVIGRYNFIEKQVEISHTGMSNLYQQILGLDSNSFKAIFLRKQNIDLIQNKADIINQALKGIHLKAKLNSEDVFISDIMTFDGYPLQIEYIIKDITLNQKINFIYGDEYILLINQAHIKPKQMQGLIEYRQKIMQNKGFLSLDEYIQKELSYLFEDVEYSVKSQQFLEKYYKDNIKNLLNSYQTCGFRNILSQNTKEQNCQNTSSIFNQKEQ